MNEELLKELEVIAAPVQQWLISKGYSPYTYLAIDSYEVTLGRTLLGTTFTDEVQ